jgi:hypothetical protein
MADARRQTVLTVRFSELPHANAIGGELPGHLVRADVGD